MRRRCAVEDDGSGGLCSSDHALDCLINTQLSWIIYGRAVTGDAGNLGAIDGERVSGSHLSDRAGDVESLEDGQLACLSGEGQWVAR